MLWDQLYLPLDAANGTTSQRQTNRHQRRRQTVSHLPARDEEIESEEIESEEIESEKLIDMRVLVKIIKYLFFVIVGLYAVALLGGPALLFHMM